MKSGMIAGAVILPLFGALCLGSAFAQSDKSSVSSADSKFVQEAALGGQAEVELGHLAMEKASSENVKQFGQRMVTDHGRAGEQLKAIAESKGINVPSGLSAKDQALATNLKKLDGAQFDDAYMNAMVKDHKKDIADFQKASKTAKDPQVKQFVTETLPTLQEHLQQAEKIAPQQSSMPMQH
jgi:putative membrane protein